MPSNVKKTPSNHPYYMIPIMLGMAGVLFSTQLDDPIIQGVIILLCLAVPLFLGGNLLGRIYGGGIQRVLLFFGLTALTLGAILAVTGLSERLVDHEYVTKSVGEWSDRLGMGSLMLGLIAVMYSMVRSEAIIDTVVDRFRHVADHIGEGFVLVDLSGRIILVNRSLLLTMGLHESDLIGKVIWEKAKELGIEDLESDTTHGNKDSRRTFSIKWKRHGQERFYEVTDTPILSRTHQKEGDLFIVRDVTEQRRLSSRLEHYTVGLQELVDEQTKMLRDSEERLRDLLVHMNEGFIIVDDTYRIAFANTYVSGMLKISPDELNLRDIFEFIPQEDSDRLRESFTNIDQDHDEANSQEFNFIRHDGRYIPIKVSIAKAQGHADKNDHFSLVVTDLEELKNMQYELENRATQLELANEELRELDRAKDTLLTNVSHELRTPLSTIEGYVEMFQSGNLGEVDAPQVGALNVMSRNIDRLSTMINEMIEFSRMEIKGIRLHETVFNLTALLEECVSSAHPVAYQNKVKIKLNTEHGLLPIWGDRPKLMQVLGILLSNAIKFSHEKSIVEVGVELSDDGDVVIAVQDKGIGIDKQNQDDIFEKFYQVDSTMTRHFEGTGIGLSIASNIIKAHGGSIEVVSALNQGATFRLKFKKALFSQENFDCTSDSLNGCVIFVTNSNLEFRAACAHLLEGLGAQVHEFYSSHEAFRRAKHMKPDYVLFGESLPDLSGSEAVKLFSDDEETKDIPVVLMLTQAPTDGAPVDRDDPHILWKPFTPYDLVQHIHHSWTPEKCTQK